MVFRTRQVYADSSVEAPTLTAPLFQMWNEGIVMFRNTVGEVFGSFGSK